MNNRKQRLELTWIGKGERPRLEPRILLEDADKSYYAKARITGDDIFDNILIHGDNLLALKALEQDYAGTVKCIYIDPPFNIDAATPHYEDGLEHSEWLRLMYERLALLRILLANDGLIAVHIDDEEMPYLAVVMDEIFGRANRVNFVSVKMSEASGVKMAHAEKRMPKLKEHILVYRKRDVVPLSIDLVPLDKWNDEYKTILTNISREAISQIKQIIEKPQCDEQDVAWCNNAIRDAKALSLSEYFRLNDIARAQQDQFKWDNAWRIIQAVGSTSVFSMAKRQPKLSQDIAAGLSATGLIYLYKTDFDDAAKQPRVQVLFADDNLMRNPGDFWQDIKTTGGVGQEGGVLFPNGKKPEALLKRIIGMCTKPGDLVLDSFGGSGTTGAVAHKMGRRWIMVELGDQCFTHIAPRLRSVIDGTDKSGVSELVGWKGGGGFRYYRLAPSLLEKDAWGNWIISKDFDAAKLAQAVCKLMGFVYHPDETHYWMQGRSSETDFIYVTTQNLTHEQLAAISEEVGDERTLLVCCKAFRANADVFSNLTIKKIPQVVLRKCEWGKDDYSLNVADLPAAPPLQQDELAPPAKAGKKRRNGNAAPHDDLFNEEAGK